MIKYFVWVKNSHGVPEAQIWFGMQTDGSGKAKATLACREMTDEEGKLGIRALADRYPAP
jgi:hypothetical protein